MMSIMKILIHALGTILIKPFLRRGKFEINNSHKIKILYITLAYRGDLILNLPAIKALKIKYPNSEIICWVRKYNENLAKICPDINRIIIYEKFPRKGLSIFKSFFAFLTHRSFIYLIRSENFSLSIDDSGYAFTSFSTFYAGISLRLGRNTQGFGFLNHFEQPYNFNDHLVKKRFDLLKPLDIKYVEYKELMPELRITTELFSKAITKLGSNLKERNYYTIQPFAGWKAKNWKVEKFAKVIDRFSKISGLIPVFIGSAVDKKRVEGIMTMCKTETINATGLLDIAESAAIISQAKIHVGVDSIGSHLAAATGIKSITIFGPTNPNLIAFLSNKNIAIQKMISCTPSPDKIYCCKDAGRSCDDVSCMEKLNVEDVLEVLIRLWQNKDTNEVEEIL